MAAVIRDASERTILSRTQDCHCTTGSRTAQDRG